MRLTNHNGRSGKHGVYSPKHNDRKFDMDNAEHINQEKTELNLYWQRDKTASSFEENEQNFYEKNFRASLDAKNERYTSQGHAERCQTMDEYRMNERSCVEETIMQVGKEGDTIDREKLWEIIAEQINWEQKRYPNVKYLDIALHMDEEGAPHVHARKCWIAHDKDGNMVVGQKKALDEMGVELPDPSKKMGKYNNQKMTYTKECREHLAGLCLERGLDMELVPKEASKSGLALDEYKHQQEQEKIQQLEQQQMQMQQQIAQQQQQIEQMQAQKLEVDKSIKASQKALKTAQEKLAGVQNKEQELATVQQKIKTATKELEKVLDMKARASEIHHMFGDKEIQTYHINMLEDTRAIGREAREHMEQASAKMQKVVEREKKVKAQEEAVEPTFKEAQQKLAKAKELEQKQESYILEKAEKLTQEKLDKAFEHVDDKYTRRMEKFLDGYSMDGKSLLETFKQQEKELKLKMSRNMGLSI